MSYHKSLAIGKRREITSRRRGCDIYVVIGNHFKHKWFTLLQQNAPGRTSVNVIDLIANSTKNKFETGQNEGYDFKVLKYNAR